MSIIDSAGGLEQRAETNLIARLANELFSGSPSADLPTGAAAKHAPGLPYFPSSLPEPPTAFAGFPASASAPKGAQASGLTGDFPANTNEVSPPIHQENVTPLGSGGHEENSPDSFAFGEPQRTADVSRVPGRQIPEYRLPGRSEEGPADYYFLQEKQSKKSETTPSFDLEGVRRDFPALHQRIHGKPLIWLDNAATTHKPQAVLDATSRFYGRDNSNIHRGAHTLATRSTELFEAGREKVRQFLGAADTKEIIFTRGTTESINLVAQSYGRKNIGAGDEIILTAMEHHANIVPWQILAGQVGAVIKVIPINDAGELRLEELPRLLSPRTKIVSVTHVSNALGTINPVEQIIALAHAAGVPVLIDGAQSTPHLPINVQALDADFFVFSGHKVFGPTGIGAVYGKARHLADMPPWQGGGHMIREVTFEQTQYQDAPEKFEAGTPDIAGVVGLGAAIDYLLGIGLPGIAAYEHALLEYAQEALAEVAGIRFIGTAANKASVLGFVIPGIPNEKIAKYLDRHGIAVRAGHHCAMPAVRHFGLDGTVRPSLAFYNTRQEVDTLIAALHELPR